MQATRVSRHQSRAERRRTRERAIVGATRALFDERGKRDAPIDDIAHTAGINKAVIYRSFDSKEEIFVLTLTDYLAEFQARIGELGEPGDPAEELRDACGCLVDFCLDYPAFLDCALALMQGPAGELREQVSGAVLFRLGRSMAACVGPLERILATGSEQGTFAIEDAAFTANRLGAQILGSMHLARVGLGIGDGSPDGARSFTITPEQMREACTRDALAVAGVAGGAMG